MPTTRPCAQPRQVYAHQRLCYAPRKKFVLADFFLVKAHTPRTHGKFVLAFVFPPALGRVALDKKITPDFSGATFVWFYFLAVAEFLAITFRISLRFAKV